MSKKSDVTLAKRTKRTKSTLSPQYLALVKRVRAVDTKAAYYMVTKARQLELFSDRTDDLYTAFVWTVTPQGYRYWSNLRKTIMQVGQ